jgi:serine/tyrosine/threonine adenylyltransferase
VEWLNKWRIAVQAEQRPEQERWASQRSVNPCYIPRQHLLQFAIDAATAGDYQELERLLTVLRRPFEEQEGMHKYRQPPPPEMVKPGICQLSCSS